MSVWEGVPATTEYCPRPARSMDRPKVKSPRQDLYWIARLVISSATFSGEARIARADRRIARIEKDRHCSLDPADRFW